DGPLSLRWRCCLESSRLGLSSAPRHAGSRTLQRSLRWRGSRMTQALASGPRGRQMAACSRSPRTGVATLIFTCVAWKAVKRSTSPTTNQRITSQVYRPTATPLPSYRRARRAHGWSRLANGQGRSKNARTAEMFGWCHRLAGRNVGWPRAGIFPPGTPRAGRRPHILVARDTSSWEIMRLRYSPHSNWITFDTSDNEIFIVPIVGGRPRKLISGLSHVWEPSGRPLFYCVRDA